MPATPEARLVWLYQAALICERFPAYTLDRVREMPGSEVRDLLLATRLMAIAEEVNR